MCLKKPDTSVSLSCERGSAGIAGVLVRVGLSPQTGRVMAFRHVRALSGTVRGACHIRSEWGWRCRSSPSPERPGAGLHRLPLPRTGRDVRDAGTAVRRPPSWWDGGDLHGQL